MKVAALVPRRADNGRRDELWAWVRHRWESLHPAITIIEGHHDHGPFNRSAAINAARSNTDADIIIVADADTFTGPAQVDEAVETAATTGRFTIAYDRYCYLSKAMSDRVMAGFLGDWSPGVEFTMQGTCSCLVVVTADAFDEAGGFDERFQGWGGEDVAFSLAAQTIGGGLERVSGDLWHLWHPPAPHVNDHAWPSLVEEYGRAAYDLPAMRALLATR